MRWTTLCLAVSLALPPLSAQAVTQDNFLVRTTGDLVAVCDTPTTDPMRVAAIHFCQGFLLGAYRFHQAEISGPHPVGRMFCTPTTGVTRDQATAMFVAWANKNPQYMNDQPVDGLARFAAVTWPCPK
jgi:hypothetical protein